MHAQLASWRANAWLAEQFDGWDPCANTVTDKWNPGVLALAELDAWAKSSQFDALLCRLATQISERRTWSSNEMLLITLSSLYKLLAIPDQWQIRVWRAVELR